MRHHDRSRFCYHRTAATTVRLLGEQTAEQSTAAAVAVLHRARAAVTAEQTAEQSTIAAVAVLHRARAAVTTEQTAEQSTIAAVAVLHRACAAVTAEQTAEQSTAAAVAVLHRGGVDVAGSSDGAGATAMRFLGEQATEQAASATVSTVAAAGEQGRRFCPTGQCHHQYNAIHSLPSLGYGAMPRHPFSYLTYRIKYR